MQIPLKCTGKVTKTLKMSEDSKQAPTESNKSTVVLLFSIARNRNNCIQVLRTHRTTPKSWRKSVKLSLWSAGSLSPGTSYEGKVLHIDHSMLIL